MRRELPRVRHLVEDEPAPQILFRQVGVPPPLVEIGLDQVEAFAAHGLGAQQLRVVLAEHALAEEGEHVADVAVDAHAAHLYHQRVGHAA